MNTINIETLEGLPQECLNVLNDNKEILLGNRKYEFTEKLSYETQSIANFIGDKIRNHYIICYHYTRANAKDIWEEGLKCRTGNEIRESFLRKYGKMFSDEENTLMKQKWNAMRKQYRDNCVFFCLTKCPLDDFEQVVPLLSHFGGEQIFMSFKSHPTITPKLKSLGKPLVVQCRVNPQNLQNFDSGDLGMAVASSFCHKVNPNIERHEADVFQTRPVPAEDILAIEEINESLISYYI